MSILHAALALLALAPQAALATPGGVQTTVGTIGSLVKTSDLDFGNLTSTGTAGSFTIDLDGARTSTGGVVLAGGAPSPADFSGRGAFNGRLRGRGFNDGQ